MDDRPHDGARAKVCSPPVPTPRYDRVTIHLTILGQPRELTARVRVDECRPVDVLPLAYRVTDLVTEVAAERGEPVTCKPGCAACCRLLKPIAPVEALAIAKAVKAMPGAQREVVRRRFSQAVRRLEEVGLLDRHGLPGRTLLTVNEARGISAEETAYARYLEAQIACPLLEKERCTIYDDRPAACRAHAVTSPPERCKDMDGDVAILDVPIDPTSILSQLSAALGDVPSVGMALPLALEWAEASGVEIEGPVDGVELTSGFVARVVAALEDEGASS